MSLDSWNQTAMIASYVWNAAGPKHAKSINDVLGRVSPPQSPEEMERNLVSWVRAHGGKIIDPNKGPKNGQRPVHW